jgi:hypothetical protein
MNDIAASARFRKGIHHSYWLIFVLFYAVGANTPFWMASHWLGLLPLGWLCIEFAGVGLLALFIPRGLSATLLLIVTAADIISDVSRTYYLSPTDCLSNLASLRDFSSIRVLAIAAVLTATLLCVVIAASFPTKKIQGSQRAYAAASLLAFAFVAISADYIGIAHETGHLPSPLHIARPGDTNKFSNYKNLWIGRYPAFRLLLDQRYFGRSAGVGPSTRFDASSIASAAAVAVPFLGSASGKPAQQKYNLVLVLLESWGLSTDTSLRSALVEPYLQPELLAKYQILQGTAPFYGSTIAGEARELCGSRFGSHIIDATSQELQNCLPIHLETLGFHSMAVHGMEGHMFSRSSWYARIGFQEMWFKDKFVQQGLPGCVGAFKGTCDAALADWIGRRLQQNDTNPDFVYWVTLNSHLPVPVPSGLPDGAPCSVVPILTQQPPLCSWYQLVANVHRSVARLAMTKLARPTIFVVVGDHAPPFANTTLRSHFSGTDVPYIVLVPRRPRVPRWPNAERSR